MSSRCERRSKVTIVAYSKRIFSSDVSKLDYIFKDIASVANAYMCVALLQSSVNNCMLQFLLKCLDYYMQQVWLPDVFCNECNSSKPILR